MISLSHWGMFDVPWQFWAAPAAFEITDREFLKEFMRVDGWIEIKRRAH
jgi:hypothetical protein